MTLYDTLGVDKNATQEDIKKAFREKAKKNHEDVGGDKDRMVELNKAYGVLKDPIKRNRYDKTGQVEEESFEHRFNVYVQQMFVQIVEGNDVVYTDLIGEFKGYTKAVIKDNKDRIDGVRKELDKFVKAKDRLGASGENRIGMVLENNIENLRQEIGIIEDNIKFMGECLECLEGYSYRVDERKDEVFGYSWNNLTFKEYGK